MKKSDENRPTASVLKEGKLQLPKGYSIPEHHGHGDSFTSTREATYRGKKIRVETTYRITIDDEPVRTHTAVLDDGTVHYHGFPNYSFKSAMDLARMLADTWDDDLPEDELGAAGPGHEAPDSGHEGGHH